MSSRSKAAILRSACALLCTQTVGSLAEGWPACLQENQALLSPQPFFADVRAFIKHPEHIRQRLITFKSDGDIGMVLRETPHEHGEYVDDVLAGSQAFLAGVRKGWIITAINGQRFSDEEGLKDLAADFSRAKQAGSTVQVRFDVRTAVDCPAADCHRSDRFPTKSAQRCAVACGRLTGCAWWSHDSTTDESLGAGAEPVCRMLAAASGSAPANGITSGRRDCVPKPELDVPATTGWPSCVSSEADLHLGQPLMTDVRPFIDHPDGVRLKEIIFMSDGNIGMGLREEPHDLGEVVSSVLPYSQARDAGVQPGWIIKEVAGRPFKKAKKLKDVGDDFANAKREGPTLTVKFDVKSSTDCTEGNCANSDKFPADSQERCAEVCAQVPACLSWSFGFEEEDLMCWLRSDVAALRPEIGSVVGSKACRPRESGRSSLFLVLMLFAGFAAFRHYGWQLPSKSGFPELLQRVLASRHSAAGGPGRPVMELGSVSEKTLSLQEGEDELRYLMESREQFTESSRGLEELCPAAPRPSWRRWFSSGVERVSKSVQYDRKAGLSSLGGLLGRPEQDFDL